MSIQHKSLKRRPRAFELSRETSLTTEPIQSIARSNTVLKFYYFKKHTFMEILITFRVFDVKSKNGH